MSQNNSQVAISLDLDLVEGSLRVVRNLGHDVFLAFDTDRESSAVPYLDLALYLFRNRRTARKVSCSVCIHFFVKVRRNSPGRVWSSHWPAEARRPRVVGDRGAGEVGAGGAGGAVAGAGAGG